MSFRTRDFIRGGRNCYLTCDDWNAVDYPPLPSSGSCFDHIFEGDNRISQLFNHLYFPYTYMDSEGEIQEAVGDCGITLTNLKRDFLAYYGSRPMVKPYYPDNDTQTAVSVNKMTYIINEVIDMNFYKYVKLIQSLGLSYEPLENYSMVEDETKNEEDSGEETIDHTVDSKKTGGIEIVGPAASVTLGTPDTQTGLKSADFTYDMSGKIGTTTDAVTDTEAGQATGGTPSAPSTVNGVTPKQEKYTTTYDSTTGRLEEYTQTQGTTAQATKSNVEVDNPVTAKITTGAPGHPSYTDTKGFTDRMKDTTRHLERRGNIGTVTAQDMLEQERNIVRFSVLKEFFKDIEKELLLSTWG